MVGAFKFFQKDDFLKAIRAASSAEEVFTTLARGQWARMHDEADLPPERAP